MMIGHGVSGLLITSAVGYWVLTTSEKEKGQVKKVGRLLALIIILVSVVGIACRVYAFAQRKGYCPPSMACPFTGKSASS